MFISDKISFISIGANCITDHQIEKIFPERKGGPFDNMTITPDALIESLIRYQKHNSFDFLCDPNMYVRKDIYNLPTPFHKDIEGLVYDHEHDFLTKPDEFLSKKNHQVENLLNATGKKVFVWSNIQPTLILNAIRIQIDIKQFYLTKYRYLEISKLIKEVFNGECKFIVRQKYCEPLLFKQDNVYIINIKENFGTEYEDAVRDFPSWKGPPMLFKRIIRLN